MAGSLSSGFNPSCHPSSYMYLVCLPSSWQPDGLYAPPQSSPWTFALVPPRHVRPSLAHLGRILGDKMAFQEFSKNIEFSLGFSSFFEPQARPTSDKMASKLSPVAPRIEFGRWSYISRLSWTVLASILGGLGVDVAPQTWRPRTIQSSPRAPKRPPRVPKSRPRAP